MRQITGLVDEGVLRPVIDRVLPFGDTLASLDQFLAGGNRGTMLVSRSPRTGRSA